MNKPRTNRQGRPEARVLRAALLVALSLPVAAQSMADIKTEPKVLPKKEASTVPSAKAQVARMGTADFAPPLQPVSHRAHGVDHTRLYFDTPGDGALWVHGARWKASFGSNGTVFIPFLGSKARANHPLAMRIASASIGGSSIAVDGAAPAQRDGQRVRYERGGVVELYDLGLDSIEQSFVFASLPHGADAAGSARDLVLRLSVGSDLSRASSANGIDLSNEDGRVHIGRATVRDASGREQAIESTLSQDEIVFTVPGPFLAGATFPVMIDPVISVFAIDESGFSDVNPDVAYDSTTDHYITVEEEIYSSSDHDVYAILTDANGDYVDAGYMDYTTDYWLDPHVANNALASQFMMVAQVNPSSPSIIRGRHTSANFINFGAQFTVNGTELGDKVHPDIGGDPTFDPPTYYLVTYQRNHSVTDTDILAVMIDPGDVNVSGMMNIENSSVTLDDQPRISKSNGAPPADTQAWTIVWRHAKNGFDHDIYAAQVTWNGFIFNPAFPIDTTTGDDHDPVVSSIQDDMEGSRRFMVASVRYVSTDNDIMGWVFAGNGIIAGGNMSSLEPGSYVHQNQDLPTVECDGHRFLLSYTEDATFPAGDSNVWLNSFEVAGPSLVVSENHKAIGYTNNLEFHSGITSKHSGGGAPGRFMVVWDAITPGTYDGDIEGGFYDVPIYTRFCIPGNDAMSCPCGNGPLNGGVGCNNSINTGGAQLTASGTTSPDTMVLSGNAMPNNATAVYLQGTTALGFGVAFGDGVRCVGGTLVRLAVKHDVNGGSSFPQAGDLSITARAVQLGSPIVPGAQRFYQTYYRDPANYACSATFNITNGVVLDW